MTINVQCLACKHYYGMPRCAAFPNGIDPDIVQGKISHDKPIKGDHGILHEELKEGEERGVPANKIVQRWVELQKEAGYEFTRDWKIE